MTDEYEEELNIFMIEKINALAALFYQMMGKDAGESFDFSKSTHPEEFGCWNMSIVAHAQINRDPGLLKYQVSNKININR